MQGGREEGGGRGTLAYLGARGSMLWYIASAIHCNSIPCAPRAPCISMLPILPHSDLAAI